MKVGVPKESVAGERRVAIVPETARGLVKGGIQVAVEAGAGASAFFGDAVYIDAGANVTDATTALGSDAVIKVQPPTLDEVARLRAGAVLISSLQPATNADVITALAQQKVSAFSLDLVPRISRAQSMDALSSQAGIAGYKAVLLAANHLPKFFPLLMTAAGTVAPARVLVMGAGVAGLQAIATSRRLGAVVEAYDVRPAVKDQVHSLGATFLELPLEAQEGTGGYAREQSEDFLRRQRELIGDRVAASDVVITTAAIPGRRAPLPGPRCHDRRPAQPAEHGAGARQPAVQQERLDPVAAAGQGWRAQAGLQRRDRQGRLRYARRRDRERPRQRAGGGREQVNDNSLLNEFTIFVLAIFIGFEVISKVPTILHTPLMSGTNAIHGIILVGAILIAATARDPLQIVLGLVAVILATINVVGGFVVTDRMLEMFKGRQTPTQKEKTPAPPQKEKTPG